LSNDTYTYTSNKLSSISGENLNVTFQYNGLGDRLSQTVNGVTTNYTLDLNSGLTQVLNDGTNTYVYGVDRIAQINGTIPEYFLTDGLGSVRQLVDSNGAVTLAKSYQPYGTETSSAGSSLSSYGFTGEMTDPTGLLYLRARYLAPNDGRFITRDSWMGDYNRPLSLNRWMYVEGNPVNATDPSGHITQKETKRAELILEKLDSIYNVHIKKDWGYLNEFIDTDNLYIDPLLGCEWLDGNWRSLRELELTLEAVKDMTRAFGGQKGLFNTAMRWRSVSVYRIPMDTLTIGDHSYVAYGFDYVILFNYPFDGTDDRAKRYIVHEFAHVIDFRQWWPPYRLSNGMAAETKSFKDGVYDPGGQLEPPPTTYAQSNPKEDWAESLRNFVYQLPLGPRRKDYIDRAIKNYWVP
jgi:RHS repeat-associated protein